MPRRILLIEDDASFSRRWQANLKAAGYAVDAAQDGAAAAEALRDSYYDLVVTDIRLPDVNGLEILQRIKEGRDGLDPDLPVVVMSSVRDIDTAVGAMRRGATDYLTKESEKQEILMRLERALEQSALRGENRYLRGRLEQTGGFSDMVGESPALRGIQEEIARLAGQDVPVLITGETGVGKELVAHALHRTGAHPQGPFVDVNCGALPDENMLLSELFGHERGAFTGAVALQRGKFELARDGTLFLDEIGELPLESQARILKAVETLQFTRLGGGRVIETRCRLIFATNRDLELEVKAGRFRQDLYYRVNLLPIQVPPLRERREDIPPLTAFFLDKFARQYRKPPLRMEPAAMDLLLACAWPGNVRELRNILERLVLRARGAEVTAEDVRRCGISPEQLSPSTEAVSANGISLPEEGVALEEVERGLVLAALERTAWNQKEAARLLRISEDRMNARVKKFGITHPAWRVNK